MAASKPFRLTALQGALVGSFFLHLLVFYMLSRPGGNPPSGLTPQATTMQVQLVNEVPTFVESPVQEQVLPIPQETPAPSSVQPNVPKKERPSQQTVDGTQVLAWKQAEAKVVNFEDIAYPPHTAAISATMEIEVSLDKDGKATDVRVLNESPPSIFTEWAWEMGMKGSYTPKMTTNGPVPSKLVVRFDILPGQPVTVQ